MGFNLAFKELKEGEGILRQNINDFASLRSFNLQDRIKNSQVLLSAAYSSKHGVKIGVVKCKRILKILNIIVSGENYFYLWLKLGSESRHNV